MLENNLIKSIIAHACPYCKQDIYVESVMTPPSINSLFTKEDVKEAKEDCLKRIETISISDEKKEAVIKWVNDPNVVFNQNEVENIILSLLNPENQNE